VYASGNALTLPDETYNVININTFLAKYCEQYSADLYWWGYWSAENFGKKNSFRMEPFHHLDISAQFIKPHKKNKRFESIFEVSIYNVYNHKNAFMYLVMDKREHDSNGQSIYVNKLAKITIFPIIPSFTYSFRF
jgi:hypothetical protein